MGQMKKGILGGFTGKVGSVVGGSWSWIDYLTLCPVSDDLELEKGDGKRIGEFMGYVQQGEQLDFLKQKIGDELVWMVKS